MITYWHLLNTPRLFLTIFQEFELGMALILTVLIIGGILFLWVQIFRGKK